MPGKCRKDAGEFDRFGRWEGASLVLLDLGEMSILMGEMKVSEKPGRWIGLEEVKMPVWSLVGEEDVYTV